VQSIYQDPIILLAGFIQKLKKLRFVSHNQTRESSGAGSTLNVPSRLQVILTA